MAEIILKPNREKSVLRRHPWIYSGAIAEVIGSPELGETEVAYLLSRQVWGRGYATEAARAAVRYGFEAARLQAIIGLVHPENAASIRVLEKCGMQLADRVALWGLEMCRYRVAAA